MGVYQDNVPSFSLITEGSMFKRISVTFVDDERTNIKVMTRKPKTKKKRIVKKWFKRYGALVADTKSCAVVGFSHGNSDDGSVVVFAVAHPLAKKHMEKLNEMNDGNQPMFTWA